MGLTKRALLLDDRPAAIPRGSEINIISLSLPLSELRIKAQ